MYNGLLARFQLYGIYMKILLTCLSGLVVIVVFGQALPKQSQIAKDNLRGRVKSMVETSYDSGLPPQNTPTKSILENKETKFNQQGKITESTLSISISKNQEETFLHQVFQYDKEGQPTVCINTKEYGLTLIDSFICDGQGNIVTQTRYRTNHTPISKIVQLYDEKGRVLLKSDYDVTGANFTLASEIETTYFDLERQRETKTRFNGFFEDALTSLDEKGRIARVQLMDSTKNTIKEWDWTYDKFDNVVTAEERIAGISKDSSHYTYEYDKTGNWIKRSEFINERPTRVTERVIDYY